MQKQHTFPQRIGKLIEQHIIKKERLLPNKRQQTKGYYDAYNSDGIYEIKAAKDNNYFRLNQKNHEQLFEADGSYILVRYSLIDADKDLKMITDIDIKDIKYVKADKLKASSSLWTEDKRKTSMYYKVKL